MHHQPAVTASDYLQILKVVTGSERIDRKMCNHIHILLLLTFDTPCVEKYAVCKDYSAAIAIAIDYTACLAHCSFGVLT